MRSRFIGVFAIALLVAFLYALLRISTLPLESGDAYPAYSSLRADPRGTKALYESLAALEELRVERNFQPVQKLKNVHGTVLMLGEAASHASGWGEQELKFYESLADGGGRLVIGFLPEPPRSKIYSAPRPHHDVVPAIITRWKVTVKTYEASEDEIEKQGSMPRETNAYFDPEGKSGWRILEQNDQDEPTLIEHSFGKGQILLLTESYPLSNEGLRAEQRTALIQTLIGPSRSIIFDESHLGVEYTGSVGTLIRRYRLTGAFAVLLLLGLLFLWKNSTSLIPQAATTGAITAAAGADAQSGLINLLKRSVPSTRLALACWDRWKETRTLGRPVSDQRIQSAELELSRPAANQAAIYRKIQKILTEKT